jgi:hypothetical protein
MENAARCPDCDVDLVPGTPPAAEPGHEEARERAVAVFEAKDEVEANLVAQALEAAGIRSNLVSDMTESIFPFSVTRLARVRVQVLEPDVEAARRLIAELRSGADADEAGE